MIIFSVLLEEEDLEKSRHGIVAGAKEYKIDENSPWYKELVIIKL